MKKGKSQSDPGVGNRNGNGTFNEQSPDWNETDELVLDIIIQNIVFTFSVGCLLDLKEIAMSCDNVELHKLNPMVSMKFRRPACTATIWSTGKITMAGSTCESDAKVGARRCARTLQKWNPNIQFKKYRVVNIMATCTMPFAIKLPELSQAHPQLVRYEPKLHPGATCRLMDIKATLKLFSTGSISIMGPSVGNVQFAVEQAYNLVWDYRKKRCSDVDYPVRERKKRKRERKLVEEKATHKKKRQKCAEEDDFSSSGSEREVKSEIE